MMDVGRHPRIKLLVGSEVEDVGGLELNLVDALVEQAAKIVPLFIRQRSERRHADAASPVMAFTMAQKFSSGVSNCT